MAHWFKHLFAEIGDKTAIPDLIDPLGYVSYETGYGVDYGRSFSTDPLAKAIERQKMNQVLNDVTGAIQQYQTHGFPDYIDATANGGTAYAYQVGAVVRFTDGVNYQNSVAGNTNNPSVGGWAPYGTQLIGTIAALRLTPYSGQQIVSVTGYYTAADNIGVREYYWDAVSVEADNGGTTIQVTGVVTGRWKMKYSGAVEVEWFGAKGDGVTIDSASFASASNYDIVLNDKTYLLNEEFNPIKSVTSKNGKAVLKFNTGIIYPTHGALVYSISQYPLSGFTVDGDTSSNVSYGVFIDASGWSTSDKAEYNVKVKNIYQSDNTKAAMGFLFYVSSASTNYTVNAEIQCKAYNILAVANTVIGDTGGSAKGVIVSINNTGSDNNISIINSTAEKIYPSEDADGIHMTVADHASITAKGKYAVINCKTYDCAKRGIKIQAQNCTVDSPHVRCDLNGTAAAAIGIDTYAVNTTILTPTILSTYASDGIILQGISQKIIKPYMHMELSTVPIRIAGATNFEIDGGYVYTGQNFANNNLTVIDVNTGSSGVINCPICYNAFGKGSVIHLQALGASDNITIKMDGKCTAETLVSARFCTGKVLIKSVVGLCSGYIIDASDSSGIVVETADAITTGATSAYGLRSTIDFIGSGTLSSVTNGITYSGVLVGTSEPRVTGDWVLLASGGTGVGVNIVGYSNVEVIGCFTKGFLTHINYNYTTNAFIGNNRARGAGTHLSATGATTPILYNNNLIV